MGLIAIGDIHGCAETLDALMDELSPTTDDHLVFVGDYIDRGPNSKAVIDRLLSLKETHKCTFLRGNHEALMLGYLERGEYDLWRINGGIATLSSYMSEEHKIDIPEEHLSFVHDTELYLDTPEFFFVHAGLKPTLSIEENIERYGEEVFLWERSHLKAKDRMWEKTVICGHTPQTDPTDDPLLINIDTGCVYYMHPSLGRLTAVRLPEREFVMVGYFG